MPKSDTATPAYRLIVQKTHGIFQHLIGNQRTHKEDE